LCKWLNAFNFGSGEKNFRSGKGENSL
jgi:hypothetical protein